MSKILIEPCINGKPHGSAIQMEKFSLDFKITNCDSNPSEEFTISNIFLKSAEGHDILENFGHKSFFVGVINPSQTSIINISQTGQPMYGLVNLTCNIQPKDSEKTIIILQKNPFTSEIYPVGDNRWIDFLYIKSASQASQERSNKWLMRLTWVMAIFALIQIIPIFKDFLCWLSERS